MSLAKSIKYSNKMRLALTLLLFGLVTRAFANESDLFQLAIDGKVETLRRLLTERPTRANLERGDQDGYFTVLHYASAGGHLPTVELLVESGANINPPSNTDNGWRQPPITQAIHGGHLAVVKYLLSKGAKRESFDVELAAYDGHEETVRFLVENKLAQVNPLVFVAACKRDSVELAKVLIENNWQFGADQLKGIFALMAPKCIELMVTEDNASIRDAVGETPLHWSARTGSVESTRWVIDKGGDINAASDKQDNWGSTTPMHEAARFGQVEVVELLLQEGADINAQLIAWGGHPVPRYRKRDTPLLVAIRFNHKDVARTLIRKGADLSILNTKRKLETIGWEDLLGK